MKKKRIKQKEDKKTDRKHGNRTRKAILGILSVLVLLCLNSCGRELEEREFPDTLVIRDSALPFEKSLQTEQDKSSKYLDRYAVSCWKMIWQRMMKNWEKYCWHWKNARLFREISIFSQQMAKHWNSRRNRKKNRRI